MSDNQIQCAECLCTLYFTGEDGPWGITGELCESCERQVDFEDDDDD